MQSKMSYETALNLAKSYGESKHLDLRERLKVHTDERFRFDFNSTDISFDLRDSILVVRSCIERESDPKREDFIAIMSNLNQKYSNELAGGYLEYDETALEVDGLKPNRLNIRMDFTDNNTRKSEFISKVNELHVAAKKWRNKYYLEIYKELNHTWFNKK